MLVLRRRICSDDWCALCLTSRDLPSYGLLNRRFMKEFWDPPHPKCLSLGLTHFRLYKNKGILYQSYLFLKAAPSLKSLWIFAPFDGLQTGLPEFSRLTELVLCSEMRLSSVSWPSRLTRLELSCSISSAVLDFSSLAKLWELALRGPAYQLWIVALPPNLCTLRCIDYFDAPIEHLTLPSSLRVFELGWGFQHPIAKMMIPWGCTVLKIGRLNSPLPKLPDTLRILKCGDTFDQPLVMDRLPKSLKILDLGYHFSHWIRDDQLPEGLQSLILGSKSTQSFTGFRFPTSLQTLHLGTKMDEPLEGLCLPSGLKELFIGWAFNQPIRVGALPSSLTSLDLGGMFNQPVSPCLFDLPKLKRLNFGKAFNQCVDLLILPESLTGLTFGDGFNQPLDKLRFPGGLRSLWLCNGFNHPLDHVALPAGLKELRLGDAFDQPLDSVVLPPGLVFLSIGRAYSRSLRPVKFPEKLETLHALSAKTHGIPKEELPKSIKSYTANIVWD